MSYSTPPPPCDLVQHARKHGDWPIVRLVGTETYAQLVNAAPGLFEPFPEIRTDGNSASTLASFSPNMFLSCCGASSRGEDRSSAVAGSSSAINVSSIYWRTSPNLVSTVLVDGELSVHDLKRLLIKAAYENYIDPRIDVLVGSSKAYTRAELSLGEILGLFVFYAIVVAVVTAIIFKSWAIGKVVFARRRG